MKIQVIRCADDITETINLDGPGWEVKEGIALNRLTNGAMEYFFDKEGRYDGWGGPVTEPV